MLFIALSLIVHPAIMQEYSVIALDILRGTESGRVLGGGAHAFSLSMFLARTFTSIHASNQWSYQPLLIVLLLPATLYFIYQQRRNWKLLWWRCLPTHQFAGVGILARQFSRIPRSVVAFHDLRGGLSAGRSLHHAPPRLLIAVLIVVPLASHPCDWLCVLAATEAARWPLNGSMRTCQRRHAC
jgi:hypothetical protein